MDDDCLFWIWLNSIKGIGCVTAKMLLDKFKHPEDIYNASKDEMKEISGLGPTRIDAIFNSKSLEYAKSILENCKKLGISILTLNNILYPQRAKEIDKAPILLYYRGSINTKSMGVAIVGSRRCTEYGKRVAAEAAEILAQNNITVISGMAKGIDSYAHTACLNKNGYTMAFLGCGVDICYLKEHRELMKRIIEDGAIISQYAPGTKPDSIHFPERNRLISAWSEKILIVEASENSGALITAKAAISQGREILAVPNNIYLHESIGTNLLIENGAKIYINPRQLITSGLNIAEKVKDETFDSSLNSNISDVENKIISIIKNKIITINELMEEVKESKELIIEKIAIMELEGKIRSMPGGRLTL